MCPHRKTPVPNLYSRSYHSIVISKSFLKFVSFCFFWHTIILITWRNLFSQTDLLTLQEAFFMETKGKAHHIGTTTLPTAYVTPNMKKQARPPIFSLWFKARRRVKLCLSLCALGYMPPAKTWLRAQTSHCGCVLEVASKNDFRTCRNCKALRICLLKTHKIVKIEENSQSTFLCALKSV